jgi:SagB-type dehydrogenase family enzyme
MLAVTLSACGAETALPAAPGDDTIGLPRKTASTALEKLIAARRSVRAFTSEPLSQAVLGDLAWAAQGVTSPRGFRTAPSAGALYPLELYIAVPEGVYRYDCRAHALERRFNSDIRAAIGKASYGQPWVINAPAQFIFTAVYERETRKYGRRGVRYTDMEAGHAAQNLMLRAVELGLGTVAIGAFEPEAAGRLVRCPKGEEVVYIICVGHPQRP